MSYPNQPNPQYGQPYPGPPNPGYGAPYGSSQPPARTNPVAAVLLLIGALGALAIALIPGGLSGQPPFMNAIEALQIEDGTVRTLAITTIASAIGGLLCLIAAVAMMTAGSHTGPAILGLIGALLMIGAAVTSLIVVPGDPFANATWRLWIFLLCGIPALAGALAGFRR